MAIQTEIRYHKDILFIKADGRKNLQQDLEIYTKYILSAIAKYKARLILIDETALEYQQSYAEMFNQVKYVVENKPDWNGRVAVVCKPDYIEQGRFWEDSAINRGIIIKFFTDYSLAQNWLLIY